MHETKSSEERAKGTALCIAFLLAEGVETGFVIKVVTVIGGCVEEVKEGEEAGKAFISFEEISDCCTRDFVEHVGNVKEKEYLCGDFRVGDVFVYLGVDQMYIVVEATFD